MSRPEHLPVVTSIVVIFSPFQIATSLLASLDHLASIGIPSSGIPSDSAVIVIAGVPVGMSQTMMLPSALEETRLCSWKSRFQTASVWPSNFRPRISESNGSYKSASSFKIYCNLFSRASKSTFGIGQPKIWPSKPDEYISFSPKTTDKTGSS